MNKSSGAGIVGSGWQEELIKYVISHSSAILSALLVLGVGFLLSRWVGRIVNRWLAGKAMDPPMSKLVVRVTKLSVLGMTLIVALGTAGVDIMALVTLTGVAGIGIGLAMQDILSNLTAGLMIIFSKPFRFGEYIEVAGVQGQVTSIELFSTTLLHGDNSRIIIPNRKIIGEILRNHGHILLLNLSVNVSYGTDINAAQAIVRDVLSRNPRVLKDPAAGTGITLLDDSSIKIAVSLWTTVADNGPAQAEIYQAIIERFRANKIEIPLPQREVRMLGPAQNPGPARN